MSTASHSLNTRRSRSRYPLKVEHLPKRLPPRLQLLMLLQHTSVVVAVSSIAAALALYAWTVYTPQLWNREYKKLTRLERYERHMTATNETLKHQLAYQAGKPEAGLVLPDPKSFIFLPPTPEIALNSKTAEIPTASQSKIYRDLSTITPLAY